MAFPRYLHDPQAVLDYPVDWTAWLPDGDTIDSVTVTADDGITIDNVQPPLGAVVIAWISGGTVGEIYTITYHVTTTDGREDDRSIQLKVQER